MPMDFPDLKSLKFAAKVHGFRKINKGEAEEDYRIALADHVEPRDSIEANEIRLKKGWDKWNEEEKKDVVMGQMLKAFLK